VASILGVTAESDAYSRELSREGVMREWVWYRNTDVLHAIGR